jgi:hypothetical protein
MDKLLPTTAGHTSQGRLTSKDKPANTDLTMSSTNDHPIERLKNSININPPISCPHSRREAFFIGQNIVQLSQINGDPRGRVRSAGKHSVTSRFDGKDALMLLDDLDSLGDVVSGVRCNDACRNYISLKRGIVLLPKSFQLRFWIIVYLIWQSIRKRRTLKIVRKKVFAHVTRTA